MYITVLGKVKQSYVNYDISEGAVEPHKVLGVLDVLEIPKIALCYRGPGGFKA